MQKEPPSISETVAYMKQCHEGQVDKSGNPYWTHPLRVMVRLNRMSLPSLQKAALLHDVVEDCEVTLDDLEKLGHTQTTIHVVDALTRRDGETYREFIARTIRSGFGACAVKLADLADNSAPGRVLTLPVEMQGIVKRYAEARSDIFQAYPLLEGCGIIHDDLPYTAEYLQQAYRKV